MNTIDIIKRAGKNLRQAKGRTFLTSLAIAVGATTITLAMAAGAGGREYVNKELATRGIGDRGYITIHSNDGPPQVENDQGVPLYTEDGSTDNPDDTTDEAEQSRPFTPEKINQIRQIAGIQELRFDFEVEGLFVKRSGQDQRFVAPFLSGQNAIYPIPLTDRVFEESLQPGQTIITSDYVQAFGFDHADQALQQAIELTYLDNNQQPQTLDLTIIGVQQSPDRRNNFVISYQDAQTISEKQSGPIDQQSFYQVTAITQPEADSTEVANRIQELGHFAISDQQMEAAFMEAVNLVQWGLVGFGALALLASIFGIINTQYISVLERTQQIGLMRAVGASRKDIARLFRYEAAWIGFLGATIGILVAMACKLAEPFVKQLLEMPDDFSILIFQPLTLLAIVAALMLIAVSAGFFPARRAAKLDPIEALRTE